MAEYWHHYCTVTVDGTPKGQGRPRATKIGNHVRVYNPRNADCWRERIIFGTMQHRPQEPFDVPVRVDIKFKMPRPKRLMRKKDCEHEFPHTSKPDRDNLDKVVLDGMKDCGWFRDDSFVCAGYIEKVYHRKDGLPGADIMVWTYRS